jgi:ligand-binding sensor domain-containing protein
LLAVAYLFCVYTVFAEQFPLKSYTVVDGLASNYVNSIYQDRKNFIWFGTGEGLTLFDGYTFKNFDEKEGLPPSSIRFVTEDEKGNLWVSTGQGIARLDSKNGGKKFVRFKIKEGDSLIEKVSVVNKK